MRNLFSEISEIIKRWRKNPVMFSFNLIGLTISFLAILMIGRWAINELSYDRFHKKSDRIFRYTVETSFDDGRVYHFARNPQPWRSDFKEFFPVIEDLTEIRTLRKTAIQLGEERFYSTKAYIVDSSFHRIFDLEFVYGTAETAFWPNAGMIISDRLAEKYFPGENPVGKEIRITPQREDKPQENIAINAVVKDFPINSHFHFDILKPFDGVVDPNHTDWAYTYLLLKEGLNINDLTEQIGEFNKTYVPENLVSHVKHHFQPITDIHLHSQKAREMEVNGRMSQVWLAIIVMLGVFVISLLNYINLNTAEIQQRSSVLRIYRVHGSTIWQLVKKQMTEKTILNTLALLLAFLLMIGIEPSVFRMYDIHLSSLTGFWLTIYLVCLMLFFILFIVGGIVPAFAHFSKLRFRRSFSFGNVNDPVKVSLLNKVLISIQFIITVVIIIFSIVVQKQTTLFKEKSMYPDKDRIFFFQDFPDKVKEKYNVFKSQVMNLSSIEDFCGMMEPPTEQFNDAIRIALKENPDPGDGITAPIQPCDDNFIDFSQLQIIAGKPFPEYNPEKEAEYFIVNESMMHKLGFDHPKEIIGKELLTASYNNTVKEGIIGGVVKDFNIQSLHHRVKPMLFFQKPQWYLTYMIKAKPGMLNESIAETKKVWEDLFPGFPFQYTVLSDQYNLAYKKEQYEESLLKLFSVICLIISCFGIFALVNITIVGRTKEIGIRKVNGARSTEILQQINKEYLKWIAIAMLLAGPVGYYLSYSWLENFAYKTSVSWWVYGIAGIATFTIALITISWQSWRAAIRIPVEALRNE